MSTLSGGPCSYNATPTSRAPGSVSFEKEWMGAAFGRMGAAVAGRNRYEAAGHWGTPTLGSPVLHRHAQATEQPEGDDFVFVDGLAEEIERARTAAGDKAVSLTGSRMSANRFCSDRLHRHRVSESARGDLASQQRCGHDIDSAPNQLGLLGAPWGLLFAANSPPYPVDLRGASPRSPPVVWPPMLDRGPPSPGAPCTGASAVGGPVRRHHGSQPVARHVLGGRHPRVGRVLAGLSGVWRDPHSRNPVDPCRRARMALLPLQRTRRPTRQHLRLQGRAALRPRVLSVDSTRAEGPRHRATGTTAARWRARGRRQPGTLTAAQPGGREPATGRESFLAASRVAPSVPTRAAPRSRRGPGPGRRPRRRGSSRRHRRLAIGSSTTSPNPPPGSGPARTAPPNKAARSRMPVRP